MLATLGMGPAVLTMPGIARLALRSFERCPEATAARPARKRGNYGTLADGSAAFALLRAASSARERTPSLR